MADSSMDVSLLQESWTDAYDKLFVLYEVTKKIALVTDPEVCLEQILFHVILFFESDMISYSFINTQTKQLDFKIVKNRLTDNVDKSNFHLLIGQGIAGSVAETSEPVIINENAMTNPRVRAELGWIGDIEIKSLIAVPVMIYGKTMGVIEIVNKEKGMFTVQDRDFLVTVGHLAALSIHNAAEAQMKSQVSPGGLDLRLADILPFGFFAIDNTEKVIYANAQAMRLLALEGQTIIKEQCSKVLTEERDIVKSLRSVLLEGKTFQWKEMMLNKSKKFVLISTVILREEKKIVGAGMILMRLAPSVE